MNDFYYLGTVFNHTGNFSLNQEHLVGKALKALNVLFYNCKKFDLKPKILCQLFDAFIESILGYGSEIWGYTKSKELERIHLKFCKRLLNVRANTCSAAVYGELGRYPLYVTRYVRIVKFWCKLKNTDNIVLKTTCMYEDGLLDCNKGHRNWVSNVKKLLCNYGFAEIFNENCVDAKVFPIIFKRRVIDTFIQEWTATLERSPVLFNYKNFKLNFGYESYLDILPRKYRYYFCRLRLSVHPLRIQTGRYNRNNTPRDQRYCLCCNTFDIEDEYHFICVCSCFNSLRMQYLKKCYYVRPSVFKFIDLLSTQNKSILIKLSKYIHESLSLRNAIINS